MRRLFGSSFTLMFLALMLPAAGGVASAETAFVVTDANHLYRFDTGDPLSGGAFPAVLVGQLAPLASPLEQIVAMDFRPATGQLYAFSNGGRLYLVDPRTATLRLLATFSEPATAAGMDFDPRADKLRIVNPTGGNFLIDPDTFAVTAQTPISVTGAIAGLAFRSGVNGSSTLYAIDPGVGRLVRIGSENDSDGASQAGGVATNIGDMGETVLNGSFDLPAHGTMGYALSNSGQLRLLRVQTLTGAAELVGYFHGSLGQVRALAVYSQRQRIHAVTTNNTLVTFDSTDPSAPSGGSVPASFVGLQAGEQIIAIDVRPSTGGLYGFSDQNRLYTISPPWSPSATQAFTTFVATVPILADLWVGMDFDPVTDRLRISTNAEEIHTVHPVTGVIEATASTAGYKIAGLAQTNSVANAAATQLYGIDAGLDQLLTITGSTVTSAISIGANGGTGEIAFDISPIDNAAWYAIGLNDDTESTLYQVALGTGALAHRGPIYSSSTPTTFKIRDIAVASPGLVRFTSTSVNTFEGAPSVSVSVTREYGSNGPVSVLCSTSDGTATQPSDYTGAATWMVFREGGPSYVDCHVPIVDDSAIEATEAFTMLLSSAFGGVGLGQDDTTVVTVHDDDAPGALPPVVNIFAPKFTGTVNETPLTLTGSAMDPNGTVVSVQWTTDRGFSGTPIGTQEWLATGITLLPGVNVVTVTATDDDGNVGSDTLVVTLNARSYYLAEGATGTFFDLDIALANPNTLAVPVTLTFLREGASPIVLDDTLLPMSRKTIRVDDLPGLEAASVSTIVASSSGHHVLVERTMRWDETGYGAHTEQATSGPALTWHFAEGAQGFFSTYLLLSNPNGAAITADVEYLIEGGDAITRQYTVPADRRTTIDIGADAALVNRSFGMVVRFSAPGVAERAMYFGTAPLWTGGHESAGATTLATNWFLAEGATGPFFETFVLVANPGDEPATVDVTYLPSAGAPVQKPSFTLGAKQRITLNIEMEDPSLANAAVATAIAADRPIVVERAQYWPDPAPNWYEAHGSFGATALGTSWGLAEGRVGGGPDHQTYILLANPGSTSAAVDITFLRENAATVTKSFVVDPTSRLTVAVGPGTLVPELQDESFGALITSTQPIVVERAMYWNAAGQVWSAGTDALGARLTP